MSNDDGRLTFPSDDVVTDTTEEKKSFDFKGFLQSVLSRKFLLALGAFITFMATNNPTEALGAVGLFVAAEGTADVLQRVREN